MNREIERLCDKTMLNDHVVKKHKTIFGKGLLMPVFVSDAEEVGIIIAKTKEAQKLFKENLDNMKYLKLDNGLKKCINKLAKLRKKKRF